MKPYKVKHIPTGLYFQPHKHRGSHLSKNGKIYQTKIHGLSNYIKSSERYKDNPNYQCFYVYAEIDSNVHKNTKDLLEWVSTYSYHQVKAKTLLSDWTIEEI
jgi:hypothetical protein